MTLGFICTCIGGVFGSAIAGMMAWVVVGYLNQRNPDANLLWVIPAAAIAGIFIWPILWELLVRLAG